LNRVVALAFFIPVVLNLAESVSSQSVSLALQVLHGQPPSQIKCQEPFFGCIDARKTFFDS